MADRTDHDELAMAVAAAWGVSSETTDSELDELASQILAWLVELRDELPLGAPVPDVLGMPGLSDREGWHREITIHRDAAHAATDLISVLSTQPAKWPEVLRSVLVTQTRRHGRPGLVAMVDALTRLGAPALSVIAQQNGQQLPALLKESLPYLR